MFTVSKPKIIKTLKAKDYFLLPRHQMLAAKIPLELSQKGGGNGSSPSKQC
jgi:hypothetical protein